MIAAVSLAVSALALFIAALTAWLTLLRRGSLLMTQPTVIYFGHDGGPGRDGKPSLKVYLRTLLYATAKRGCIIEGMYICLRRGEGRQNFNVWVYGEKALARGSGLFVPDSGLTANHHFLMPEDGAVYNFAPGKYIVYVYATIVGLRTPRLLYSAELLVTPAQADALKEPGQGLYYDWGPEAGQFNAHIRPQPKEKLPPFLDGLFGEEDQL